MWDRVALVQAVGLACRDFIYERRISVCFILALVAVLAPLLVLFGLKFGLVDTMAARLIEDPRNREILPVGSRSYPSAFFEAMRERPEVAFIMPATRLIAASFSSLRNPETRAVVSGMAMFPSAQGDPLLADSTAAPSAIDEIVLSEAAARDLDAGAGAGLEARLHRKRNGNDEFAVFTVHVADVVPASKMPEQAALVPLELLVATEDFLDGFGVPEFGAEGPPRPDENRDYARFRLVARSIYDVLPIRESLKAMGIEVYTRASEIETMQALDRALGRVFWLIAGLATTGFLASLTANLLANVDRKRRDLSMLRLIGFPTASLVMFPITQASIVALLGSLLALGGYWIVAQMLNAYFVSSLQQGELICKLLPRHAVVAVLATVLCAAAAAAWPGLRASQIQPAEGVRDV